MKQIQITANELSNFIHLAKQHNEIYHLTIKKGIIFIQASITFLNNIGF